jgi:hypothetical protein
MGPLAPGFPSRHSAIHVETLSNVAGAKRSCSMGLVDTSLEAGFPVGVVRNRSKRVVQSVHMSIVGGNKRSPVLAQTANPPLERYSTRPFSPFQSAKNFT